MSINATEVALLLRQGIPAKQADALAEWITQTQAALDAAGTVSSADHTTLERTMNGLIAVTQKLDDDATVTDTDYEAVLDAILNPA